MTEGIAMTKYQCMPSLTDSEYQALKEDIKVTNGILVPIDVDDKGNILDGHHRVQACQELGIKSWPTIVRGGMSEREKQEYVYRVNVNRRQLGKGWKRQEACKLRKKLWSYEEIARALGLSYGTAWNWTHDVIINVDNETEPETRTNIRNQVRPTTYKRHEPTSVFAQTPEQAEKIQQSLQELEDDTTSGFVSRETVTKKAEKKQRAKKAEEVAKHLSETTPKASDRFTLFCGDLAKVMPTLAAESIDSIITDPPYPREFLPLYNALAREAARVLKPSGCLYMLVGQSYLPDIFNIVTAHIAYRWIIAYLTPGAKSAQLWDRKINTFWKPVLCFSKGTYQGRWTGDVVKSKTDDKCFHEWGQSVSGMVHLIESYTEPSDLVLDPCCGSGTTGVAALTLNRRFTGIDIEKSNIVTTEGRLRAALSGNLLQGPDVPL